MSVDTKAFVMTSNKNVFKTFAKVKKALQDLIYGSHLGDTAITIVLNNWLRVDEKVLASLPEKDYNYYITLSKVEDLLNAKQHV